MAPEASRDAPRVLRRSRQQGVDATLGGLDEGTGDVGHECRRQAAGTSFARVGAQRHVAVVEIEAEPAGPALDLRGL